FWALLTLLFPGNPSQSAADKVISDIVFAIIVILGCIYKLASVGVNIAISRDWVVVIADGRPNILTSRYSCAFEIELCLCKAISDDNPLRTYLVQNSTPPCVVSISFVNCSRHFSSRFLPPWHQRLRPSTS